MNLQKYNGANCCDLANVYFNTVESVYFNKSQ